MMELDRCDGCEHPYHGIAMCKVCGHYPFATGANSSRFPPPDVTPPRVNAATIRGAWHDATCPEAGWCESRGMHALYTDYMVAPLQRFLDALPHGANRIEGRR